MACVYDVIAVAEWRRPASDVSWRWEAMFAPGESGGRTGPLECETPNHHHKKKKSNPKSTEKLKRTLDKFMYSDDN
ncbi:hypothetical protein E2C01_053768 [Portunus trituberculatus]|uniref:Uncharacterized protein n=1 Tax=Portunus trituberculatus TaxID=210409 RepID=A0A5B7GHM3_PORTR|nr:hypothetical protein [Portunus trituberculatus]